MIKKRVNFIYLLMIFLFLIFNAREREEHEKERVSGYDRFQINNMEEGNSSFPTSPLDTLRAHDPPFGKFLASPAPGMPFLLWEPDRQTEILALASNYLKGPLAPGGFRFAANIDPVQLDLYAARSRGDNVTMPWNNHLKGLKNASLTDTPMVTSPSNQPSYFQAERGRPVIMAWREYESFVVQVCRVLNSKLSCRDPQQIPDQSAYFESWSSVTVKSSQTFFDLVLAGDDTGHFTLYRVGDDDSLINVGSSSFYENRFELYSEGLCLFAHVYTFCVCGCGIACYQVGTGFGDLSRPLECISGAHLLQLHRRLRGFLCGALPEVARGAIGG